jgi:YD repeat-containing protein
MGRLLTHRQTTDGTDYDTGYTYNLSGALIEETYPSTRVVKNTLDADGQLSQIQSKKNSSSGYWQYANSFTYNPAGALTKMQLGNGRWETAKYNDRLQVTEIGLGNSATDTGLLKLSYEYGTATQNNGSMLKQTIKIPGWSPDFVQTYTYDALTRTVNTHMIYAIIYEI